MRDGERVAGKGGSGAGWRVLPSVGTDVHMYLVASVCVGGGVHKRISTFYPSSVSSYRRERSISYQEGDTPRPYNCAMSPTKTVVYDFREDGQMLANIASRDGTDCY